MRTCVVCRQPAPQRDLVRIGSERGALHVDGERRLAGRGAYVHPGMACTGSEAARQLPGGLARSLRRAIAPQEVAALRQALLGPSAKDRDIVERYPGTTATAVASGARSKDARL